MCCIALWLSLLLSEKTAFAASLHVGIVAIGIVVVAGCGCVGVVGIAGFGRGGGCWCAGRLSKKSSRFSCAIAGACSRS